MAWRSTHQLLEFDESEEAHHPDSGCDCEWCAKHGGDWQVRQDPELPKAPPARSRLLDLRGRRKRSAELWRLSS